jgi:integrase
MLLRALKTILHDILGDNGCTTQQKVMQAVRMCVAITYGVDSLEHCASYKLLFVDKAVIVARRNAYQSMVAAHNRDKTVITASEINNVLNEVNNSWKDLAIVAEMSSGARIGELLSKSSFADMGRCVAQRGISKSKERDVVVKPVIFQPASNLIVQIGLIREQLADKIADKSISDVKLSRRLNAAINRRIRKLFNRNDITTHTLRKIYAIMSYDKYADKSKYSEIGWVSRVLGHAANNLNTAASYSTIGIVYDLPVKKIEDTDSVVLHNSGLNDGKSAKRVDDVVRALDALGESVSPQTLMNLGFGAQTAYAALRR